jgi:hypothetical protein
MMRVSNIDLSPSQLMRNSASPGGPLPANRSAEGGSETQGRVSMGLLASTMRQVSAGRQEGVGGRIDLLG